MSYRQQTFGPVASRSKDEKVKTFKTTDDAIAAIQAGRFLVNTCAKIESTNAWVANYDGVLSTIEKLPTIDGSLPIHPIDFSSSKIVLFNPMTPCESFDIHGADLNS